MAEAIWLVRRTIKPGDNSVRNSVHMVLINADDGQTAAQTIAEVVTRMNIRFGAGAYPASYFDSAVIVGDLTSGILKDDLDCLVILPLETTVIESTET